MIRRPMERIIMWSLERIIRKEVERSIWRPGRKPEDMIIKRPCSREQAEKGH